MVGNLDGAVYIYQEQHRAFHISSIVGWFVTKLAEFWARNKTNIMSKTIMQPDLLKLGKTWTIWVFRIYTFRCLCAEDGGCKTHQTTIIVLFIALQARRVRQSAAAELFNSVDAVDMPDIRLLISGEQKTTPSFSSRRASTIIQHLATGRCHQLFKTHSEELENR